MGRTCTVCRHEKRDEIDRALVAGEPFRHIAAQYGTNTGALQRHKIHVPATLTKARDAKDTRRANDLWARVERVMEKLETALNSTEVAKDIASLSRELLGALRMALEGRGELRQGPQVQVNVALATSPEWLGRFLTREGPFSPRSPDRTYRITALPCQRVLRSSWTRLRPLWWRAAVETAHKFMRHKEILPPHPRRSNGTRVNHGVAGFCGNYLCAAPTQ